MPKSTAMYWPERYEDVSRVHIRVEKLWRNTWVKELDAALGSPFRSS
jgi:hypothetical protein